MRIGFIIAYGFNLKWIESTLFLFTLHHSLNKLRLYALNGATSRLITFSYAIMLIMAPVHFLTVVAVLFVWTLVLLRKQQCLNRQR